MSEAALSPAEKRTRPVQEKRPLGFDAWLLVLVAVMVGFGLVMVYSASWDVSWRLTLDPTALFRRQVSNLVVGIFAMIGAALIPLAWLRKAALPVILLSIGALIAVLLMSTGDTPRRAFLSGSVQPSELAKLALIIYLAVWMESKGERLSEWAEGFIPLIMIVGIVAGLILLQPDLSAVLTAGAVALAMFYLAGAPASRYVLLIGGSGLVGYVLIWLTNTGRQRWQAYVAGLLDIEEASYHVQQSLQAFFSGGVFGRGLGASRAKFGLLPAPHTDSIFAVIGEELGLIGALAVLTLFCLFLWRGFRIAVDAPDRLSVLLAGGVTFWIGIEALVNMSVLLGLLPFAGNALPFFSYGGSILVTSLTAVGLLLNVTRRAPLEVNEQGHVATIGVGWRHGGRRVSRLSHRTRPRRPR